MGAGARAGGVGGGVHTDAPRKFANLKSKASRFGPKPGVGPGNGAPLDVTYETDVLGKASLETSVKSTYARNRRVGAYR